MSKAVRDARWRDSVIAARIFEARGVNGREPIEADDDRPRHPAPERMRHLQREHVVCAGDDSGLDVTAAISVPSIDDERSASRASAVEARRFFDLLFDIATREPAGAAHASRHRGGAVE